MLADLDLPAHCGVMHRRRSPGPRGSRRTPGRELTDAEVATLASPRRSWASAPTAEFLAVAEHRLGDLFPKLPRQPGFHKRRRRLTETIEWLIGVFADRLPRSRGLGRPLGLHAGGVRALGRDRAALGAGRRLRIWLLPLALSLVLGDAPAPVLRTRRHPEGARSWRPADQPEREVALRLLPQALRGGEQIVCDKGYAGREFAAEVEARFAAEILRPNRKDEPEGCRAPLR